MKQVEMMQNKVAPDMADGGIVGMISGVVGGVGEVAADGGLGEADSEMALENVDQALEQTSFSRFNGFIHREFYHRRGRGWGRGWGRGRGRRGHL